MRACLEWLPGLAALLLAIGPVAAPAWAQDPAASQVKALAEKIDQQVAQRWADKKIKPAAPADDAEFVRRVYVDLAGRIPSVAEVRAFLEDRRPDRRARLVERLLASPLYINHSANVYRALMIPEAGNNFLVRLQQSGFEQWLRDQVAKDVGYDKLVSNLLTASLGGGNPLAALGGNGGSSPLAFFSAKEFKPESLAAGTARAFLGVSVECAQCHNHPFADWKREEFWGLAAFYSGIRSRQLMDILVPANEVADQKEITMPGADNKVIQARFLDGTQPEWKNKKSSRAALAEWVTSPTNPYFAKATVNRTWAYFFGTGLVEPIDEMVGSDSTSSHPAALELLTREFIDHKFDTKFLIRVITSTKAYQLTSAGTDKAQDDATLFARMPLRGMTAEQLFDSVAMATGFRDNSVQAGLLSAIAGATSPRGEFMTKFATQNERATKSQTSILQALSLMNGKIIAGATSLDESETLAAVLDAPFLTTAQRVETLYLSTLSRQPTAKELDRAVQFVENARNRAVAGPGARREAYNQAVADVFWVLLNSSEFVLNH